MYKATTPMRNMLETFNNNPSDVEFKIKLEGAGFLRRIAYNKVTINRHKTIVLSGLGKHKKEIRPLDIKQMKRLGKERFIVKLSIIKNKTFNLVFVTEDDAKKFFRIMGYYLTIDPALMD